MTTLHDNRIIRPVLARDPNEPHRAATPLELLYDLVLVIAVGAAAAGLHHSVNENHIGQGIYLYLFVFWTLWWPWVNFTWYASAYDNDDVLYRCLVFLQMIGAMTTAAGIHGMIAGELPTLALIGFIIMRIGMIGLWLRAAQGNEAGRKTALRYAAGITLCQVLWIIWYCYFSDHGPVSAIPIIVLEMLVPMFAERSGATPWHRHHIIERYGLLLIIVFGESLVSAGSTIGALTGEYRDSLDLWSVLIACFVTLFSMWWIYFGERYKAELETFSGTFLWGYAHYFVFASAAAVGAGIGVLVDQITHHSEVSHTVANAALAVPVAVYLLGVWLVQDRGSPVHGKWQLPLFAVLVLLTPALTYGPLVVAVLMVACLAMRIREDAHMPTSGDHPH